MQVEENKGGQKDFRGSFWAHWQTPSKLLKASLHRCLEASCVNHPVATSGVPNIQGGNTFPNMPVLRSVTEIVI